MELTILSKKQLIVEILKANINFDLACIDENYEEMEKIDILKNKIIKEFNSRG